MIVVSEALSRYGQEETGKTEMSPYEGDTQPRVEGNS